MWKQRITGRNHLRRLYFEQFESRRLMAVTTSLNNGTLAIIGDAAADDVAILGTANPGEIMVIGRNGTLVDGIAPDPDGNSITTIPGVTAHVNANFGAGHNVINVDNVFLAGHLEIFTLGGNDRVTLGATGVVSTAEYCTVATGDGSDVIRAEDYKVFIAGSLGFFTEGGAQDSVTMIGASALEGVNVVNAGLINTQFNEVVLRGVTSAFGLGVSSRAPVNNIAIFTSAASGALFVDLPSGQNSVYLDTNFSTSYINVTTFTVSAPPQTPVTAPYVIDATVTVARCIADQIAVYTGGAFAVFIGGDDRVNIYGNLIVGPPEFSRNFLPAAHVIYIETGDGNDAVDLSYNVAQGDFFASLAEDNDTLSLIGNSLSGFASADGGDGTNTLNLFSNQFGGFAASRFS